MSRVFRTPPNDPRRLSMLAHQRATQTPGERRRIHGPIVPLDPPREPMTRGDALILIAAAVCTGYLFVRVILPGAFWLAAQLGLGA